MGFLTAQRGQQYSGSSDSPDVRCDDLPNLHCEVKYGVMGLDFGTKLLADALEQAHEDATKYVSGGPESHWETKPYYVAWRPNRKPWRITYPCPTMGVYVTVCGRAEIKQVLLRLNGGGQ